MTLTPAAIQKIAKLSRLRLTDAEVTYHQENLDAIFKWIDTLQNIDVSNVSINIDAAHSLMHEREDVVTAPNRVKDVLKNAPSHMHDMFAVPKVVE